jgi:hypothetical protein
MPYKKAKKRYLEFLLILLGLIGFALIALGALTYPANLSSEDVITRINILTFLVGFIYLAFVYITYKTFLR